MASPRPAPVISRRAEGTTPVDTRGWMGGVSRRAILSIKPETFFRAVSETSLKTPRSLASKCVKGYTLVEGLSRQSLSHQRLLFLPASSITSSVAFAPSRM
jgi:hypothetical protein